MRKIILIKAGKYNSLETKLHLERDCNQKCRFGFNWWYWLPNARVTKYHIDFWWFCYTVSFYRKAFFK